MKELLLKHKKKVATVAVSVLMAALAKWLPPETMADVMDVAKTFAEALVDFNADAAE